MAPVSKKIERLIVRKLDGELTDGESLVLDRELLRHPEARAMLEDYTRIDALAGAVIATSVDHAAVHPTNVPTDDDAVQRGTGVHTTRPAPHPHRWMWYASAAAACLALILHWTTPWLSPSTAPTVATNQTADNTVRHSGAPIPRVGFGGGEVGVFNAADITPGSVNRVTDREYYLVPDQQGAIYLFSVDRIRQVQQPVTRNGGTRRDPI